MQLRCQKEIAQKIAKDNDYILDLKVNHLLMEQEIKDFFLASALVLSPLCTFHRKHPSPPCISSSPFSVVSKVARYNVLVEPCHRGIRCVGG